MSLARNLSKFKPSSSGLVETADIADDAVTAGKIEHNPAIVGNIEPTGSVRVADSQYFQAGNSYDLQMYHDGSNSYIEDQGTGDLILKGTAVRLRTDNLVVSNTANNEDMITAAADGAVNLRHNNVSCLTTTSDGGITVNGGNIVIGTSGKGIDFSATGNVSGTGGETLDDFEEGSFDVAVATGGGSITINSSYNTLSYTKIGHLVIVSGGIRISSVSSPSGAFALTSVPFTPKTTSEDTHHAMVSVLHDSCTGLGDSDTVMVGQVLPGNSAIYIYTQEANGVADPANHFQSGSLIRINICYLTAS